MSRYMPLKSALDHAPEWFVIDTEPAGTRYPEVYCKAQSGGTARLIADALNRQASPKEPQP